MSKALDLDAILARANAATPGPWTARYPPRDSNGWATIVVPIPATSEDEEDDYHHITDLDDQIRRADADFMAAARTDAPDLVAAVRDRDTEIATLKARLAMAVSFQIDREFSVIEPGDDDGESRGFWQAMRSGDGCVLTDLGDWIDPDSDVGEARFPTADAAFAALNAYRARATEKP